MPTRHENKNQHHGHSQHDHEDMTHDHSKMAHDQSQHDHSKMTHEHKQHGKHDHGAGGGHSHHDHHAHMVAGFRKRFWISLALTAPILLLSPMIQRFLELGTALQFPGYT